MKKIISLLMFVSFLAASCSKTYDEMEKNPNNPESVPASIVLNGVEVSLSPGAWAYNSVGINSHVVIITIMEIRSITGAGHLCHIPL
jgi:hypothetical protein